MPEYGVRMTGDGSGLVGATRQVVQEQKGLEDQLNKNQSAAKANAEESARFVQRLREEADTIGKTRAEVERYRAGQIELTAAQKTSANESLRQIEAHERMASVKRAATIAVVTLATAIVAYAASMAIGTKHVIDQAAELHNLSQSYGISTAGLSAYRYQMSLAGVSNEEFSMGMKTLSKNISEAQGGVGNGAQLFKLLGNEIYTAVQRGASLEELLPTMADRFARFADGPNKTALAMEFFGRAGERMIPMLNQGAAGMRAAAQEASELGRIIGPDLARAADEFNSNLTRMNALFEASKYAIARDVLPALDDIIQRFIRGAKEGGVFYGVLEAAREAATQAMTPSKATLQSKLDRTNSMIKGREARGVYYASGDSTLRSLYASRDETQQQLYVIAMNEEAARVREHKRALAAYENAPAKTAGGPSEYQQLTQQIQTLISVQQLELETGQKLTQADRVRLQIIAAAEAGTLKRAVADRVLNSGLLDQALAVELANRQRELEKKAVEEATRAYNEQVAQQWKVIDSTEENNRKLQEHNEEIGLTTEQLGALKVRRAEEALAIAEQNLALTNMKDAAEDELAIAQARVKAAREFVQLVREGAAKDVSVEQAKKVKEEWQRTSDNIERSLTDALMRGFDKGKSFMQNLKDGMINAFKTAILTPIIQPIVRPVAGMISSAIGGLTNSIFGGGAGGGGFNPLGLLNSGSHFINGGSFGNLSAGSIAYGIESSLGLTGVAQWGLAEEAAALGIGGLGEAGLAASGLGAALPWVGGALLVGSALGLFGDDDNEPPPGYRDPNWLRFLKDAGGYRLESSEVPDPQVMGQFAQQLGSALNDAGKYDPAILDKFVGMTVSGAPGTGSQDLVSQLVQALAPAAEAVRGRPRDSNVQEILAKAEDLVKTMGEELDLSSAAFKLQGDMQKLLLSDVSPLTMQERLDTARGAYASLLDAAQGGDAEAILQLSGGAQAYLREARDFYASSPAYTAIFQGVQSDTQSLIAGLNQSLAEKLTEQAINIAEMTDSMKSVSLNTANLDIRIAAAIDKALAARETASAEVARAQTRELVEAIVSNGEAAGRAAAAAAEASLRA